MIIIIRSVLALEPRGLRFELILRDAALVRPSMGEEVSPIVWDRCQPSILRNLDITNL